MNREFNLFVLIFYNIDNSAAEVLFLSSHCLNDNTISNKINQGKINRLQLVYHFYGVIIVFLTGVFIEWS